MPRRPMGRTCATRRNLHLAEPTTSTLAQVVYAPGQDTAPSLSERNTAAVPQPRLLRRDAPLTP
ncbi:hypothetical protein GCM10018966_071620 [Streptomyces yanii]